MKERPIFNIERFFNCGGNRSDPRRNIPDYSENDGLDLGATIVTDFLTVLERIQKEYSQKANRAVKKQLKKGTRKKIEVELAGDDHKTPRSREEKAQNVVNMAFLLSNEIEREKTVERTLGVLSPNDTEEQEYELKKKVWNEYAFLRRNKSVDNIVKYFGLHDVFEEEIHEKLQKRYRPEEAEEFIELRYKLKRVTIFWIAASFYQYFLSKNNPKGDNGEMLNFKSATIIVETKEADLELEITRSDGGEYNGQLNYINVKNPSKMCSII